MKTDKLAHPPVASHEPSRALRLAWRAVAFVLVAGIFLQAVFAGAMLSGVAWASDAHATNASLLVAAAIAACLAAAVTLHRIAQGPKLAATLLALAIAIFLQTAIGKLSANGANLMWLHIPLGVALVGLAGQTLAAARRLGGD